MKTAAIERDCGETEALPPRQQKKPAIKTAAIEAAAAKTAAKTKEGAVAKLHQLRQI